MGVRWRHYALLQHLPPRFSVPLHFPYLPPSPRSKQLRTRDCTNCTVNLYSKTDPIIEKSSGMVIAPFNLSYPGLDTHFKAAALDPACNHWRRIFDFSKDDTSLPEPHWKIADSASPEIVIQGSEFTPLAGGAVTGEPVNPAAPFLDAQAPEPPAAQGDGMLTFDIRSTSQAAAQAALEAVEAVEEAEEVVADEAPAPAAAEVAAVPEEAATEAQPEAAAVVEAATEVATAAEAVEAPATPTPEDAPVEADAEAEPAPPAAERPAEEAPAATEAPAPSEAASAPETDAAHAKLYELTPDDAAALEFDASL